MNKRIYATLLVGLAISMVTFSVSCGGDDDDEALSTATPARTAEPTSVSPSDEVQLTDSDDGATVQLANGGTLIVALPSNPTTGYSWSVSEQSSPQLVLDGEPQYVPAGSTSPVVGAGGTEVLTFEATGAGTATLTLEYRRPFEPGAAPEETFTVTVEIR